MDPKQLTAQVLHPNSERDYSGLYEERPQVEIVIPVYNEQAQLADSIHTLYTFLTMHFPYSWRITIADNASTDGTWQIAGAMQQQYRQVRAFHLERKGRGRALKAAWLASQAAVVCYMDVDLSTGLECLEPMVAPLLQNMAEVGIGSRLAKGAGVTRGLKREIISRGYNLLIKGCFLNSFSDAQCGFKAVRTDVARQLLPLIQNNEWFFDTELLLLAEHNGMRIHEVPVRWIDDPDSRVNIRKTMIEDLKGLWRMRTLFWRNGGRLQARDEQKHSEPAVSAETATRRAA